jgi:ketosteroid isomerase-like protein
MTNEDLDPDLQRFEGFQSAAKGKDPEALQRILHDDYSIITSEGEIITKRQLIENVIHPSTNFLSHNFKRTERHIAISEDGNTVTEVADVELIGDLIGEDRTGPYINTATYVKGPNGWQIMGNTITKTLPAQATVA